MGAEMGASFYDAAYERSESYALSADQNPWAHLHFWALGRLGGEMVFDLGCGVGHLAELLARRGHPAHRYMGVDFSEVAIERARSRVPGYQFVISEILAEARRLRNYEGATVVLCEVLEHITHDLPVLRALNPGTRVLATVPSYDSAGHVRHFDNIAQVAKRYEHALHIESITRLGRCYSIEGLRKEKASK